MTPSALSLNFFHKEKIVPLFRAAISCVMCSPVHTQGSDIAHSQAFYSVWVCRGWTAPLLSAHSPETEKAAGSILRCFFSSCLSHEYNIGFMEVIRKFNWKFQISILRKKKSYSFVEVYQILCPKMMDFWTTGSRSWVFIQCFWEQEMEEMEQLWYSNLAILVLRRLCMKAIFALCW